MEQAPNNRNSAVALSFDPSSDAAPRVSAKGFGKLADQILELAREHDIPIRQDRDLIQVLSRLDLEEEIPPQLYRAVAEILAFVYLASRQYQELEEPHAKSPSRQEGRVSSSRENQGFVSF